MQPMRNIGDFIHDICSTADYALSGRQAFRVALAGRGRGQGSMVEGASKDGANCRWIPGSPVDPIPAPFRLAPTAPG